MVTYAERPWTKKYDAGVPKTLEPYPQIAVQDLLRQNVQKFASNSALITSVKVPVFGRLTNTLSYSALDHQSDALAVGLIAMGLKKGDRVVLMMPNITAFIISYYAILKAGGVIAAANPTYPADKLKYHFNDCEAELVITASLFYKQVKAIQPETKVKTVIVTNVKEYFPSIARLLFTLAREKKDGHYVELEAGDYWFQDVLNQNKGKKPNVNIDPDHDLALFQYTGGTTGVAKAAMATHKALVANTLQCRAFLSAGDTPGDQEIFLGAAPMFHAYGLIAVLNFAISIGAKIALVINPRDMTDTIEIIDKYKPTLFMGVPAMYNAINNHPKVLAGEINLRSLRACISGSAPLPPDTKERFEQLTGSSLREGYGMSEAPTVTHCNPLLGENRTASIGLPMVDMDMKIVDLDDSETEVPMGEIGELVMAGPQLMIGYHGMPTETANVIREKDGKRWLYTGDIARMDADGYFYIVDRKKDMALIGGFNVYPTVIENVLAEHPAVLEVGVAAIPHPDKVGQEALKAWVVVKQGQQVTEKELVEHCSKHLARYEVPTRFAFVAELPRTAIGKTLRRELVRLEMEERENTKSP